MPMSSLVQQNSCLVKLSSLSGYSTKGNSSKHAVKRKLLGALARSEEDKKPYKPLKEAR